MIFLFFLKPLLKKGLRLGHLFRANNFIILNLEIGNGSLQCRFVSCCPIDYFTHRASLS